MALLTSTYRAKRFYDLIVVGGAGGVLLVSNNGEDWQSVPSGITTGISALAVADNKIILASGSTVRKTENLQSWTVHNTGLSGTRDIAYGAGKWVVTGSRDTNSNDARTSSSDNGENWIQSPSHFTSNSGSWMNRIVYGSQGFLSQGWSADSSGWASVNNRSSVDGVTWSARRSTGYINPGSANEGPVGYGNGIYYSIYKSGGTSGTPQRLHYGNISTQNDQSFINSGSDFAYGNGVQLLTVINTSNIYRSTNGGVTWAWVGTPAGQALRSIIFVLDRFIAVGNGGAIVVSDSQGLNWTVVNHGLTTNTLNRIRAGNF